MAIVVDVRVAEPMVVAEEWRCEYSFDGMRCEGRRVKDDCRYCDLHDRWEHTAMAELGAPLPVDARSTQLFLALALSEVMNRRGNRTDAEIQGIISLAKLMAKNACFL